MFDRVRKRGAAVRTTVAALSAALTLLAAAPAVGAPGARTPDTRVPPADAPPKTVPVVVTTQQEVVVTRQGYSSVTIPADATSVKATLSGAASDTGVPGDITTGNASIGENGPLRPGQTVMVVIDSTATVFGPSVLEPWLSANAGGPTRVPNPPNRAMFPDAATQPGANTGPGRALLVFTVPTGDIGELPSAVDFGPVAAPGTALRNVPFTNSGGAPLSLTSITATPPFSIDATGTSCVASARIPVGGNCSIAVRAAVNSRGPVTGTLAFTGNIPGGSRTVTLTASGITVPGVPGALTATPGDSQAVLSWLPPADDGGSPLTGYEIFRSGGSSVTPVLVGTVAAATQVHTDTGLTQNTAYMYAVRAVNTVGTSAVSAPVSATPVAELAVTTTVLSDATAGQGYHVRLQASGGVAPYRWSVEGTLPTGILLDPLTGELGGMAADPGQFAFVVRVSDSAVPAHEAEGRLSFAVLPAPAVPPASPAASPEAQAAHTPVMTGDESGGGSDVVVWAWVLLGVVGLIGAFAAIRRLRAARA